jgi:hypothetical protein
MNDNDEHLRDEQQRQQLQQLQQLQENHGQLRSERKARGELRNTHLEAGREQARSDHARTGERNPAETSPVEDTSADDYEAEHNTRKEADRAKMKAQARSRYEGSDDAFERDWPEIREHMVMENLENELKHVRTGL